ncbi:MAG: 4-(cytidine 5'-diphospho)-2-C-methyl-D-erythritol kinase [Ignavibacteria bacterium]|nr:4-(cytidine 5'-diphospho)-2-C-methyl-D-erythritol kinase [Ignavibacteria bacterium]
MIIKAPAKINIGLRILNKRDDGYHTIETIFYPVKLFDKIDVSILPSESDLNSVIIKTEKHAVPLTKTNTCVKIIESFFQVFRIKETFKINIFLEKNIPIGGGLGGGSSDAGSLLRYLVKYFKIDIAENRHKIIEAALSVGSDVPFFLIQKPCYATGRGEKLKLLNKFLLDYDVLLVNPNKHVSTKWAYENLNFDSNLNKETTLSEIEEFDIDNRNLFENEFETVVFEKYPELAEVKNQLVSFGADFTSLSGSGAVLYGLFDRKGSSKIKSAFNNFKAFDYFVAIG